MKRVYPSQQTCFPSLSPHRTHTTKFEFPGEGKGKGPPRQEKGGSREAA